MITENQLDEWVRGNSRDAQGVIVELVARLVAASVPRPNDRRFPLGDSIDQPGPDGRLDTEAGFPPYVPSGISYWEIGTGDDLPDKATRDYNGLTTDPDSALPGEERGLSGFVFVTPLSARRERGWTITKQRKWIATREAKQQWRSIRVIDGTQLCSWMSLWPSVERWLAKRIGLHGDQLMSPSGHWRILQSIGQPPPMGERVFLAGREEACQKVQGVLDRNYNRLKIVTRYPGHVADFVAAFIASMEPDRRIEAEGRCLIVRGEDGWSDMCDQASPQILVADSTLDLSGERGTKLIQRALLGGHAAVFWGGPGTPDPISVALSTPTIEQLRDALVAAGYSPERARLFAERSAGDLDSLLRLLQNLTSTPEWAQGSAASDLAIAEFLGEWTDTSPADAAAAEGLAGKPYGEWIEVMRTAATTPGTPLIQHEGRWKLVPRYEAWHALGPRLFDVHLDRFLNVAVTVLGERDPQFELIPEERYLARVQGKVLNRSSDIAQGVASGVALLGTHPVALNHCTRGKPEATAALIVRQLAFGADWVSWASMNDFLPLLAEAAPEQFLAAVEDALQRDPNPFATLFSQEGRGAFGSNYLTGTLWALETLAWDPALLSRALLCLAGLAEIDPGGNWGNRPISSMTTILLPWLPQTCARAAMRHSAVATVLRESPAIGWDLLLSLLPHRHMVSNFTRRPAWRDTIPNDWSDGVVMSSYWEDVEAYVALLLTAAGRDASKLSELVDALDDLPTSARDRLLAGLSAPDVVDLPEAARLDLWTKLVAFVTRHRAYADAQWALPPADVDRIEEVATLLAPQRPSLVHRRLFTDRALDVYEEQGHWEKQRQRLAERQEAAIREIFAEGGAQQVVDFAAAVETPWRVGWAYGSLSDLADDELILPGMLQPDDKPMLGFAGGYIGARAFKVGSVWANQFDVASWTRDQVGQFLAFLSFEPSTWKLAARLLGDEACEYWTRANVNPYPLSESLEDAADHLMACGRFDAAIDCLYRMSDAGNLDQDRVVKALTGAVHSSTPSSLMTHECLGLIKALQASDKVVPDLGRIEWAYLALLDEHSGARPVTLERALASDPAFFCYVIGLVFKSKRGELPEAERDPDIARNGYLLLSRWRRLPGLQEDGAIDRNELETWMNSVRERCGETGHLEIAMEMVGHCFAYAPADPGGLWIHTAVAGVLDARDGVHIREGFEVETLNQRGAHWVDPSGKQEEELRTEYLAKAEAVDQAGFSRLAATVRGIAKSYELEADRVRARHGRDD